MKDKEILDWIGDKRTTNRSDPKRSNPEYSEPEQFQNPPWLEKKLREVDKKFSEVGSSRDRFVRTAIAANALRSDPLEFALVMLATNYYSGQESQEYARFVRTEVQAYALRKGWRYTLNNLPAPIPEFIEECVDSEDVMDEEQFYDYKETYRVKGVKEFIADASSYKEERARQLDLDSFASEFRW
ncbi:MAG: hypothetical protein AABX24_00420 [Nanoarchaeota archaeon]